MFVEHGFYMKPLTGKLLDADDVSRTGYINILDPKLHVTGPVRRVRRQRVNNNLLGNNTYCPLIRRTDALNHATASGLGQTKWTCFRKSLIVSPMKLCTVRHPVAA